MERYLKKQLIIGGIFFLIIAFVGIGIYFTVKPKPSCFDKIQNQGEEDIDCGGPCSPCEKVKIKELKLLFIKYIQKGSGIYNVVAKIENPNFYFGVSKLVYKFKFYDKNNDLIKSFEDTSFILPKEKKYLILTNLQLERKPSKVSLFLQKVDWQKVEDYTPLALSIFDKEYKLLGEDKIGFSKLIGKVYNKTTFNFKSVEINGVLFDEFGNVIEVNKTKVNDLNSGEIREFQLFWSKPFKGKVKDSDLVIDTNIFSEENFLKEKGGTLERFQQ